MLTRLPLRILGLLVLFIAGTNAAHAQTPPITYQRYDTLIALQPDGAFRVREIQQIRFDGEFHTAFAEIPTALTTEIRNVQLYEGETAYRPGSDAPNTFTTEPTNDVIYVSWEYTPTLPGDVRTFVLEYEVVGGLWVYPNETILEWRAVPADRSGILVASSTVTVTLPVTVTQEELRSTAYGPAFQTVISPTQVIFTASEALPDGVNFQVQVGLPSALVTAERQPWQRQEDNARLDYRFKALNVELTLDPDGVLWVDEYYNLAVAAGALDQGYRQIPLRFVDEIDQIELLEGEQRFVNAQTDCLYCLQIRSTPSRADWVRYDPELRTVVTATNRLGAIELGWQFPPLVRGEETTLHLRYRVLGAVRQLADRQEIKWQAVFADREQTVESAQLRLRLPITIARSAIGLAGGKVAWQEDGAALVTAGRAFYSGQSWDLTITLPATATQGTLPQWQQQVAAAANQAVQAEVARARWQLGFGVAALLILLLGGGAVYLLWYRWGRDRPLPAVADYLPEPPSHLPPAIVAYLVDEAPSVKGALAALLDLANWGLLAVRFDSSLALKRVVERNLTSGEPITLPTGETLAVPQHLVTLLHALQPALPLGEEQPLHQIYPHFQAILPRVYQEMGEETNRASPLAGAWSVARAAQHWRSAAVGVALLGRTGLAGAGPGASSGGCGESADRRQPVDAAAHAGGSNRNTALARLS